MISGGLQFFLGMVNDVHCVFCGGKVEVCWGRGWNHIESPKREKLFLTTLLGVEFTFLSFGGVTMIF
jgi:hypothetical protein